jgi:hypothetical protein
MAESVDQMGSEDGFILGAGALTSLGGAGATVSVDQTGPE